jgi:dipeptidyl aminopeptidase/acylaminoacyl peptidase
MTPADLRRVVVVEELDLSADGRTAIVVRRSVRGDRYVGHLYAIDLTPGRAVRRPRQLTRGLTRDTRPRLSADGHTLAFVRTDPRDEDSVAAIALLDLRTPGDVRMARLGRHGAVGELGWSPDGRRLAFTAEVDPPRFLVGRVPSVSRRQKDPDAPAPLARRITRTDWRWDEEGHRDHWSHLFVMDTPRGRPRQVTAGDYGVEDIAWHPDGRTIAFTADRGPEPDVHPRTTIWAIDVDAEVGEADEAGREHVRAEPREILAAGGWANHPAWSPDGRWMAAIGILESTPLDDVSPGILLGPADGSRPPHALAPDLDRPIGNWVDTDLDGWMVNGRHGPFWLDDGTILATVADRGRSHPHRFRLDPATGAPRGHDRPAGGDRTTHTMAVARNGVVATLGTLGTRAMEVTTLDLEASNASDASDAARAPEAAWTTRSRLGARWQDRFALPEMRRTEAPGRGGPIDVWIASPPGIRADTALPTVVDIHGGPLGSWAPAPHLEVILLASAGYRVVLPNIRGSATYGAEWIRPQLGDWGGVDAADVHAAVDHVVALGLADPERLGILGLSYGGFMVNWMVGTTGRFRAAVSENGVTNQISDWANSDSGPEYDRAALLGDPFSQDGIDRLWRQSPLRHVAEVRTPLLMLQAEADLRCPPHDNEQFFIALRHLGRTVEYVLYPEESHVYASAGRIDRRVDRMTRVLAWFARYLR